jgi:alkanesulfonate monooxygenase SsuD/methylene tetrahydromethanopterin reductase-like flavin-dependent oxidoreductase (luciferase family)
VNLGVYVDSSLSVGPVAQAAERAGLSHLWLYDSPLVFGDTSMACLVAAQATSRIAVGPGVANPLQRPPEYTAQMLATLQVAAPGRVFFGIGVGNSARHSLRLPPAKLADVAAHVRVVRGMLDRGVAVHNDGSGGRPVRFIHPDGRWVDPAPVPIWVSAFGPTGQRLAGELADGVLIRWEGAEAVRTAAATVATGERDPGLIGTPVRIGVIYAVQPIDHDDELDTAAVRAALGPLVVSRLRYLTANASSVDEVPPEFRDGFEAYREYRAGLDTTERHLDNYRGYLVFTPPDLEHFVTPASMRAVALVGSPGRIAEELRAMATAGIDHCSLQMAGDTETWCARMAEQVFPLLGRRDGTTADVEVAA